MKYTEEAQVSKEYKAEYASSLEAFINKREDEYTKKRDEYTKNIFADTERYREDFKKYLGWPLTEKPDGLIPAPISTRLSEEDGYTVYRMTFDVLDGIKMTGLYFEMNGGKKPFVIVQHGGGGTPELISGINGSTYNYNEMLERVISHDVHAFCPQLLLWEDKYGAPYDRITMDAALYKPYEKHGDFMVRAIMEICSAPTAQFVTSIAHPFCPVCCPYPAEVRMPPG